MMVVLCRTAQSMQQLSMEGTVRVFEFRWEEIFTSPFTIRLALESTQPPLQWVLGLLPAVTYPERDVNVPPPSSAQVKTN